MPPVAQFSLPTPKQPQQGPSPTSPQIQGMPPVAQFQLPGAQATQPTPTTKDIGQYTPALSIGTQYQQTPQSAKDYLTGEVKGVASLGQSADVLNTMKRLEGAKTDWTGMTEQQRAAAATPTTPAQKAGSAGTILASLAVPAGEAKAAKEAIDVARAPAIAQKLAAPAITKKGIMGELMSLRTNPQQEKDAQAILPLVKNKILKLGSSAKVVQRNVANIKSEIGNTAQGLVSRLHTMDVQPTVQPEELNALFQKTIAQIKDTPRIDENIATQEATKTWNKFLSFLPKNAPATAEDILKARKATDAWVESSKGEGIFDPSRETGFSAGLRAFRQGANDLVASKAPDQGVKEALSHQTSLYNVLENISKKGASAVQKARQVENMPTMQKLMAQHPLVTKGIERALEVGGLGLIGGTVIEHASRSSQ